MNTKQVKDNSKVRGKLTFQENFMGIMRAYEDNLLVGSSTWLMAAPTKVWEYRGWEIFARWLPTHPAFVRPNGACFHATCMRWTADQNQFHLHDHNCATDLMEIREAIDYWNENDRKYDGKDDKMDESYIGSR